MTLERIEHKVFASEAPLEEMGQFGSALATTKLNTKDVAEIQALPAYTKGWGSAIISENNYPAMEEMNGVLNVMSYHTGYLYQEGIPTYSATQEYSVTSWVKDLAGEKVYKSLQGGNKGHDLTDPAWWEELKLGGGGLEIGDIGIAPLGIDETKGKRRYLNGQLIIQEQYVQFTNKVKSAVALYPSLACTEDEWQTAVTMSTFGACGKFVIDDTAGTIRLPKITGFIQGLTDLSQLANLVDAGLPTHTHTRGTMNITGTWRSGSSGYGTIQNGGEATGAYYKGASTGSTPSFGSTDGAILGFDASRSWTGSTSTGNYSSSLATTDTVQPEAIKYPYFIQVATGAETEDNIINEIELNNPFSLLDYKYSEYELNNLSWLRSQGQYNSKVVYPAVYDLLLKIYNKTETKAGVSVKLSTGSYTDYDFVLNTADETFRLPIKVKQKFFTGGDVPVVGNGMTLGLSNGTQFGGIFGHSDYIKGNTTTYGSNVGTSTSTGGDFSSLKTLGITTDSSKSGMVAKISQSEVSGLYLYFYVGETVQNANLINAGRIEEHLHSLIPDNSSIIAGYAMPSNKYISVTLGASNTTYTAPANGYYQCYIGGSSGNKWLRLFTTGNYLQESGFSTSNNIGFTVPIKKGETLNVRYSGTLTVKNLIFIYAEGEV